MTIEQEFFEAFGIEPSKHFFCGKHLPRYKCVCWDRARQRNSYCKDWDYKNKKCEFYTEDIERRYYPPITTEIVLGLIKILLDCDIDILIAKDENGYIARKNIMSYSMHWVVDENFNNTVLKLCIQLQPNIQDQVKALFKC